MAKYDISAGRSVCDTPMPAHSFPQDDPPPRRANRAGAEGQAKPAMFRGSDMGRYQGFWGAFERHNDTLGRDHPEESKLELCLVKGSKVRCADGIDRPIEELGEGDMVLTRDHGAQPIRWLGTAVLDAATLRHHPELRPIAIKENTFGTHAATIVSPMHRVLIQGCQVELMFGTDEVLAPIHSMLNDTSITIARDLKEVVFHQVLFDQHEIIMVDGIWAASVQLGTCPMQHITGNAEIAGIFPDLGAGYGHLGDMHAARMTLTAREASVLAI